MPIKDRIFTIESRLPSGVQLVGVSKFQPSDAIRAAYAAGLRSFAESRPQELAAKAAELPSDIEWHFIGHLQRNKVDLVVGVAALIESVDSERLLEAIGHQALKKGIVQRVLLQVHIAQEQTKQGFSFAQAAQLLARSFDGIEIVGLMGMATYTDSEAQVRAEFLSLKALFDAHPQLRVLSIGMSGDWPLAVDCGATQVRIGSAIFGVRN